MPSTDLIIERWLNNAQALEDSANFIANVKIDGLDHNVTAPNSKWIYYGVCTRAIRTGEAPLAYCPGQGSYAGARAAHMRVLYPDLVFGAIASSAVTQ